MHLDAGEQGVGAGQVDELEEAERAVSRLADGLRLVDALLVDQDELAGGNLAVVLGADQVERARLGREHRVAVDRARG